MMKWKKVFVIALTAVMLSGSAAVITGCGSAEEDAGTAKTEVSETEKVTEQEAETEDEKTAMETTSDANGFQYNIRLKDSVLEFNAPKGYYYNKLESEVNGKVNFRNSNRSSVTMSFSVAEPATESVKNYLDDGTWEGYASEPQEVIEQYEIDSKYGPITVLKVGFQDKEFSDMIIEYGIFNYQGGEYMLSRRTIIKKESDISFQDIIEEMFTESALTGINTEENKVEFDESQYEYILSDIWEVAPVPVIGINVPTGYTLSSVDTLSTKYDTHEIETNTGCRIEFGEMEGIEINITNAGYWMENFCDNGVFEEENEYFVDSRLFDGILSDLSVLSAEKKETIDTPFGPAQIVYGEMKYEHSILSRDGEKMVEGIRAYEMALLRVNGYTIIADYYYDDSKEQGHEYQGILAKVLPEIFAPNL